MKHTVTVAFAFAFLCVFSRGLCDTVLTQTHCRNVFIKDCRSYDVFFLGLTHSMENALIKSSAARAFAIDGSRLTDGKVCTVTLRHVLLRRVGAGRRKSASA